MTTAAGDDRLPTLLSNTYQSEEDDPRTSDESESELEIDSSSGDGWLDRHHARFCKFPWTSGNHWPRLPPELKSMILKDLSIKELKKIAGVAPHLAHEELRLRVKALAKRAHLKISTVIDMLRDTGSVISGSAALLVLVPCSFVNAGLDIFCSFDQHRHVLDFLRRNGYGTPRKGKIISMSRHDRLANDPDFHSSFVIPSAIHAIYQVTHEDTGYIVSVVRSRSSCSIAPILGYHSTFMMNWISWDGVSCMYPALTIDYMGLTTALSFNYVISERVSRALTLYRDRGFLVYDRCSQIRYHSPQSCYYTRSKLFLIPNGKVYSQGLLNPYCKRTEREINDWGTLSMAFTARSEVVAYPIRVNWKLAMQFLGQEADYMLGCDQKADCAWIEVQGERQYSQYSVLIDPNVQQASPDVDLNEFP
ncbi:hypothetical protein BKA70DRAFT_1239029 [Coprinopsis sp. MPI-PUGE-AT-0042]|nr:hypothetical protein BKA70DRAFT_1239029 [Coprinopsis sp. MPI-PUGE-AT-0042]